MIVLAIVGTGGMARTHAKRFAAIRGVRLAACCDIVKEKAEAFAADFGIPAVYTDYRDLYAAEKLDAVSIVTPDDMHAPCAIAAAEKGLHILCEKPLATSVADARRMCAAAAAAGVINMVNFSYRDSSGLRAAAARIAAGGIGRIRHVEASYLQSWLVAKTWGDWHTMPAFKWRLSKAHGSLGVLGDVGCHIYDMTAVLAGDMAEIHCRLGTFDKGGRSRIGEYILDANDSFIASVVFANGALGTIHSTRWATGHINSLRVRVFGERGGIEVDLDRSWNEYRMCRGQANIDAGKWTTVRCRPVPNAYARFVRGVRTGKNDPSDFRNGLRIQKYLKASFASAARGKPVRVFS
jgi:predicted dehydrogenase